jgi:hypothetical protein
MIIKVWDGSGRKFRYKVTAEDRIAIRLLYRKRRRLYGKVTARYMAETNAYVRACHNNGYL